MICAGPWTTWPSPVGPGRPLDFTTDFEDRIEFAGVATLRDAVLRIAPQGLLFEEMVGPLSYDSERFRTEGLAVRFGDSPLEVVGELRSFLEDPRVDAVATTMALRAEDFYDLLGSDSRPTRAAT